MFRITVQEKEKLLVVFPDMRIVRTAKSKGNNRGKYYCEPRPGVKKMLDRIRFAEASKSRIEGSGFYGER